MSLTYRGWICLDVDGTRWGRDESHRALAYPTAAEARAGGAAHVRQVMSDAEDEVRDREVARFLTEAVAVEVSIRCDVQEQGLAALRWLGEDSNMRALSDARLVGLPDPEPEPDAGAFRSAEAARRRPVVGDRWSPGPEWPDAGWADQYEVVSLDVSSRRSDGIMNLRFEGQGVALPVSRTGTRIGRPGDVYLGCFPPVEGVASTSSPAPGPVQPEPDPVPNDQPAVWDLVLDDMKERDALGRQRYGTPLQPRNGRKPLRDLYQELLDAVVYVRQELYEREGQ